MQHNSNLDRKEPGRTWLWCSDCNRAIENKGYICPNCYLRYDGPLPKGKKENGNQVLGAR